MRGWTPSSGRPFPEPCLCGALDCPKCYPKGDREEEEQEIEYDDPPDPSDDDKEEYSTIRRYGDKI